MYIHTQVTALGVLCCFALFVCLTLLASFFLPSHLSFKNMYIHTSSCFFRTAECESNEVASPCGSLRSLSSSTCTCQERPLRHSYLKGVDGRVFKDRMEVSYDIDVM